MGKGKLIVIEGLDGVGKSTQLDMLRRENPEFEFYSLPWYEDKTGGIITDYLSGGYPDADSERSGYAAAMFYAMNRYALFLRDNWRDKTDRGKTVVFGRYTTSNAIYQGAKIDMAGRAAFTDWMFDFEYNHLKLPKPDKVIFLHMPIEISARMLANRGGEGKLDIHERDVLYREKCERCSLSLAKRFDWTVIDCFRGDEPLPADDVHNLINHAIGVLSC